MHDRTSSDRRAPSLVPSGLLCSAPSAKIPWLVISELVHSDITPPLAEASSIVIDRPPQIFNSGNHCN